MKRIAWKRAVSLLLALLLLTLCASAAAAHGRLPGDMDRDGKITAADARIVLRIAVGLDSVENYMDETSAQSGEIAMVTDIGQLMDNGFNQGTWEGVRGFADAHGVSCAYYLPGDGSDPTDQDRIDAMETAIDDGAKVIVAPGFLQATAIEVVARRHPEVRFIFVDGWVLGLENVTAITYKEEQAGYLAGYAAVSEGCTRLGFTGGGGGTNPAVNRYGYGFLQGAEAAAAATGVRVSVRYSYRYGETFSPSAELQAQIDGWYGDGVQAVFVCGGSMFESVKAAAARYDHAKIIGVDVDQSFESSQVMTSAMKCLANSVEWALGQVYAGKWNILLADTEQNLGAAEDAIGLPTDTWSLTRFTPADYRALYASLKSGVVTPKAEVPMNLTAGWTRLTVIPEK